MTIIVILGITAGLVAFSFITGDPDELERLRQTIDSLKVENERLDRNSDSLEAEVYSLQEIIKSLLPIPKCWLDVDGEVQRVLRVEIYQDYYQLTILASEDQLRVDDDIREVVNRIDTSEELKRAELESILQEIREIGKNRTDLHASGCRFFGQVEMMEEMDASLYRHHVKIVNEYIITGF